MVEQLASLFIDTILRTLYSEMILFLSPLNDNLLSFRCLFTTFISCRNSFGMVLFNRLRSLNLFLFRT